MGYENDAGMSFRCLKFSLYPEFDGELLRGSKQGANRSDVHLRMKTDIYEHLLGVRPWTSGSKHILKLGSFASRLSE